MRALLKCFLAITLVFATLATFGAVSELKVNDLRCEYVRDPLGMDSSAPRLFWKLESPQQGQRQTAYEILAATSAELLSRNRGDLWDSGKVKSDENLHISYAGKPLRSSQKVFWKLRVWDEEGRRSSWSDVASWTMGVMKESEWQANWIGTGAEKPAEDPQTLLLRREFAVKPGLRRATTHICGLGCYEMSLNGQKVGDALFPPGWTKYDKTCQYDTYDITSQVREGQNAVGLWLGNGMYNVRGGRYTKFTGSFGPLKAIGQVHLEYADGTSETIGTDGNWRWSASPITFSCVYGGEDYDARAEQKGWNQSGFNDSQWKNVAVVKGPGGTLKGFSCAAPPIRAFEVLKPLSAKEPQSGITVYDLGQNASMMPRLKVRGPAGSIVRIHPAELLGKEGLIDRVSCGNDKSYWQYTLSGKGEENWFPKFFYHGCRYLQVERLASPQGSELPEVQLLEGVVVHSASDPVGQFECSNPLFNRIRMLVRWAQRSNMMSVMTDCPHREKLGWLEEYHLNGPSLRYEFDLARLFTKAMND
ncbi:MAG TPA: family 78 glycoside hydrolase catalytic domain, partial [Clostridia bacterium]|nr:family 78 glycoside hydrolase catalytic domain [Clostridia bacterium]